MMSYSLIEINAYQKFNRTFEVRVEKNVRNRNSLFVNPNVFTMPEAKVEIVTYKNLDGNIVDKLTILEVSHNRESTYNEEQILEAIRFKKYFDKLYEKDLDTSLEPFNKLYENAIDYARVKKC